jgi:alpha-galactosidase
MKHSMASTLRLLVFGIALLGEGCAKDPIYATPSTGGRGQIASGGGFATGSGGAGGAPTMALTPPMGWNSWNKFQSGVNDGLMRQIADAMVTSGMAAAGYEYVVLDDTWSGSRDANGRIVPDLVRFPDMKGLADYVHAKGLKFGIHSDRGTLTCSNHPASFGYETNDAQTFAEWGVDYVKYDNCNPSPMSKGIEQDFRAMGDALRATGRPMIYSICAWWFYGWEPSMGQLWRTTTDIEDNWTSVTALLDRNGGDTTRYGSCTACPTASAGMCVVCNPAVPEAAYAAPGLAAHAGPGHWNDPDMLEVGNGGMTDTEYRSHFSLWAMMAAPLIAGNDLRSMTPATLEILTNAEVIAVDQDPLGVQGRPINASTTLEVWSKRLSGAAAYAVVLFNRGQTAADIAVTWNSLGITSNAAAVRDLWAHQDLGRMPMQYTAMNVPGHGVVMLKVVGE